MSPRTELDAPRTQPPTQTKDEKRREFSSLARKHRKEERDRRSESQWRKRSCALMLGMFRESEPDPVTGRRYTDEAALDAFAPHGSERIEDRYFTADMEARERKAWQVVEAAKQEGGVEYLAACRTYLRLVEAMQKAADRGLIVKPMTLRDCRNPSLKALKMRPTLRRRPS